MKKAKLFLLVLMVPVLFQISCKKDDPAPAAPTYKEPSSASMADVVTVPDGLTAKANTGTEFGASIASSYMEMANAFSSFGGSFTVPDNATIQSKKSGSTVYFWSYSGYSYWMTYSELSDKYTWKYEYEFPDMPRFTFITADEAKNEKSGSWTIFDPEAPANYMWTYEWSYNASNSFIADLNWGMGVDGYTWCKFR